MTLILSYDTHTPDEDLTKLTKFIVSYHWILWITNLFSTVNCLNYFPGHYQDLWHNLLNVYLELFLVDSFKQELEVALN